MLARRARISLVSNAPPEIVASALSTAQQLGLTPREIDVLRALTEGRSNAQIAARLFITTKTASLHVSHILAKLGVSNRLQAALAGEHLGILDSDEPAQQAVRHQP